MFALTSFYIFKSCPLNVDMLCCIFNKDNHVPSAVFKWNKKLVVLFRLLPVIDKPRIKLILLLNDIISLLKKLSSCVNQLPTCFFLSQKPFYLTFSFDTLIFSFFSAINTRDSLRISLLTLCYERRKDGPISCRINNTK